MDLSLVVVIGRWGGQSQRSCWPAMIWIYADMAARMSTRK